MSQPPSNQPPLNPNGSTTTPTTPAAAYPRPGMPFPLAGAVGMQQHLLAQFQQQQSKQPQAGGMPLPLTPLFNPMIAMVAQQKMLQQAMYGAAAQTTPVAPPEQIPPPTSTSPFPQPQSSPAVNSAHISAGSLTQPPATPMQLPFTMFPTVPGGVPEMQKALWDAFQKRGAGAAAVAAVAPMTPFPPNINVSGGPSLVPNANSLSVAGSPMGAMSNKKRGRPGSPKTAVPQVVAVEKSCNCKQSKCLKLYCECFAAGQMCNESCRCFNCHNNPSHQHERSDAIKDVLEQRPNAFAPKVHASGHLRGCHCKRSGCLKKYCECFQAGVKCTDQCKCKGCKNQEGHGGGGGEEYSGEPSGWGYYNSAGGYEAVGGGDEYYGYQQQQQDGGEVALDESYGQYSNYDGQMESPASHNHRMTTRGSTRSLRNRVSSSSALPPPDSPSSHLAPPPPPPQDLPEMTPPKRQSGNQQQQQQENKSSFYDAVDLTSPSRPSLFRTPGSSARKRRNDNHHHAPSFDTPNQFLKPRGTIIPGSAGSSTSQMMNYSDPSPIGSAKKTIQHSQSQSQSSSQTNVQMSPAVSVNPDAWFNFESGDTPLRSSSFRHPKAPPMDPPARTALRTSLFSEHALSLRDQILASAYHSNKRQKTEESSSATTTSDHPAATTSTDTPTDTNQQQQNGGDSNSQPFVSMNVDETARAKFKPISSAPLPPPPSIVVAAAKRKSPELHVFLNNTTNFSQSLTPESATVPAPAFSLHDAWVESPCVSLPTEPTSSLVVVQQHHSHDNVGGPRTLDSIDASSTQPPPTLTLTTTSSSSTFSEPRRPSFPSLPPHPSLQPQQQPASKTAHEETPPASPRGPFAFTYPHYSLLQLTPQTPASGRTPYTTGWGFSPSVFPTPGQPHQQQQQQQLHHQSAVPNGPTIPPIDPSKKAQPKPEIQTPIPNIMGSQTVSASITTRQEVQSVATGVSSSATPSRFFADSPQRRGKTPSPPVPDSVASVRSERLSQKELSGFLQTISVFGDVGNAGGHSRPASRLGNDNSTQSEATQNTSQQLASGEQPAQQVEQQRVGSVDPAVLQEKATLTALDSWLRKILDAAKQSRGARTVATASS